MVKREKYFPPVYFTAIAAALTVYPVSSIMMKADFSFAGPLATLIALTGLAIGSALFSLPWQITLRTQSAQGRRRTAELLLSICAGILLGSVSLMQIREERQMLTTLADQKRVTALSGTILSDPVPCGNSFYFLPLRVTSCTYSDHSVFSACGNCMVLMPAALIREAIPGGIATESGGRVLYASGVTVEMKGSFKPYSENEGETFFASEGTSLRWQTPLHLFRAYLRLSLMKVLYGWGDAGGFLLALFSANRDYLSPSLSNDFRVTGLSHILALSGMHLSLIALVVIQTGKRLGGRRFAVRLSLLAIVLFVWFAGASPSLNRALIMAFLIALARFLGFRSSILPILAATFLIQLLFMPAEALTLAFMLSYGALWGILTFSGYLSYLLSGSLPKIVYSDISVSIGAQLMTTPIIALTIGVLAPIGIIASCLISPLSSFFLVAGMMLTLISVLFPPLGHFCAQILDFMYRCIAVPVHAFASVNPLSIKGLEDTMTACIVPILAGVLLMYGSAIFQKRRSPDACFARL